MNTVKHNIYKIKNGPSVYILQYIFPLTFTDRWSNLVLLPHYIRTFEKIIRIKFVDEAIQPISYSLSNSF